MWMVLTNQSPDHLLWATMQRLIHPPDLYQYEPEAHSVLRFRDFMQDAGWLPIRTSRGVAVGTWLFDLDLTQFSVGGVPWRCRCAPSSPDPPSLPRNYCGYCDSMVCAECWSWYYFLDFRVCVCHECVRHPPHGSTFFGTPSGVTIARTVMPPHQL